MGNFESSANVTGNNSSFLKALQTPASFIFEKLLCSLLESMKKQNDERKTSISYRKMLDTVSSSFEGVSLDFLVPYLRMLTEEQANTIFVYDYITQEISHSLGIKKFEAEDYTKYIFKCVSLISPKAKEKIDSFYHEKNKDLKEEQSRTEMQSELSKLEELIRDAKSSFEKKRDYYTISEVEANLVGITQGVLDFSFFDDIDVLFEENLKRLLAKDTQVIEIYSGCQREAFLYVLKLLSDFGYESRTKVVTSCERWNNFAFGSGDILVSDFEDPKETKTHSDCINIRVNDRRSYRESNNENFLIMRSRSSSRMRRKLQSLFGNSREAQEIGDKYFYKTNGYYSLIEAELVSVGTKNSWDNDIEPGSEKLERLEQFLVLQSFRENDFDVLERNGFGPERILKTAREINRRGGTPLFTENTDKKAYSLNAPDRLWCVIAQCDSDFTHFFIEKAVKLLCDSALSEDMVNNILYSYIRHISSFIPKFGGVGEGLFVYPEDKLFDDVAPVLLKRDDRESIIKVVTELCPSRMLDWYMNNPEEITDDNAESLLLLMHDKAFSEKCAKLIIARLNKNNESRFNYCHSLLNITEEFLRPIANSSGLSSSKIMEIIEHSDNKEILKNVILEVLPREHGVWTPCCIYYRYRDCVKDYHRCNDDAYRLAEYEMDWYLKRANLEELTAFVKNVSFIFFDFCEPLSFALNRVIDRSSEEERMPLYLELFSLCNRYKRWPLKNMQKRMKLLDKCLDLITPLQPHLAVTPFFSWASNIEEAEELTENSEYIEHLSESVKEHSIPIDEYLMIPEFLGNKLMSNEYSDVFVNNYDENDCVSLSAFSDFKKWKILGCYLNNIKKRFGQDGINRLFDMVSDEDKFNIVKSSLYFTIKDLLPRLPEEKQNEYWKSLQNFTDYGLTAEEKKYALDRLIEAGNNDVVFKFIGPFADKCSDEELCSIIDRIKKDRADKQAYILSDWIFPRLRLYSDAGGVSSEKVFRWELELLPYSELFKKNTFFVRRFKESPSILCELFALSYKTDAGEVIGGYTSAERETALDILSDIAACPGVDSDYVVDEEFLFNWIKDFIRRMEKQNQKNLVSQGIASVVVYSVPTFEACLPDEVCRILDTFGEEFGSELVRHVSMNLAYIQSMSCIYGVSAGRLSAKFKDYEITLKGKGFSIASKVYADLSAEYAGRDEDERRRGL